MSSALAPIRRRDQLAALLALAIAAGAVALVALGGLGRDLVYAWGPSQLRAAGQKAIGASVRLGGIVGERSIRPDGDGVAFEVEDGKATVPVRYRSPPPQMFREGVAVVVEGRLGKDGVFEGARLMVSHGNEYRAREGPGQEPVR